MPVTAALGLADADLVIFDTGGGSSQFTFGHGTRVDRRFSVNVGAVRFTERFHLDQAVSEEVLEQRGITRLPTSLREAVDLFAADEVIGAAFGRPLMDAIVAVRESEQELFADATGDEVAAATRWLH